MKIPLTSLSYVDWLVYADYAAENYTYKDEYYARRIGNSLKKMYIANVDPRCLLAYIDYSDTNALLFPAVYTPSTLEINLGLSLLFTGKPVIFYSYRTGMAGVTSRFMHGQPICLNPYRYKFFLKYVVKSEYPITLFEPSMIHNTDSYRKLLTKFWRLVVIRASGIPNNT